MSEEEKKAIDELTSWRDYMIQNKKRLNKADLIIGYMTTCLNLIQNKQSEIEKKDKIMDLMAEMITIKIQMKTFVNKWATEYITMNLQIKKNAKIA